ncbi:MAG: response regulator [Deltaproteobacteria bacterium]|nr:response regulator [Deltaproteobacteria bacterium]
MERAKRTVLVIDDEAHIRRIVELKMKNAGYEVVTANNGEEGYRIILGDTPDVVVTDINMPKMDGKTLCEKTDGLKAERSFLTVIITARILPDEQAWVSTMRDTVFMEKPFSPARLLDLIDQYFGLSR